MNFNSNNSNKNEIIQNKEIYREDSNFNNNFSITKKNTIEYDNIFTKDFSMNSQEIQNKYLESEKKNSTNLDFNDINNRTNKKECSYTNGIEESYNKNIYGSKRSLNDILRSSKKNPSSFLSSENKNDDKKYSPQKNTQIIQFSSINKKPTIPSQSNLITDYKNWKGNNYFPFNANFLEGPCSFRPTLLTACAMTVPVLLFYIFISKYLTKKYSIIIPIIIGVIYLIEFIYLIVASFCDPGIIRRFNIINDDKTKDYIKRRFYDNQNRKDVKIFHLGYLINYSYCFSCGIIRPKRSTHCSDCNNCVERLDHHCPWIGNCAGKRNYIYFFIFIVLLNIQTILIIIFSIFHIISKVKDYSDLNKQLPEDQKIKHLTAYSFCDVIISLYLIIYSIITMCFITILLFYHFRLICVNSTTKEELRHIFKTNFGNPYKRSICQNIRNALCPPTKKYSILYILRRDFTEICDPEYNKNYSDEENETNIKLNIDNPIINNLNNNDSRISNDGKNNNNISNNNIYNFKDEKEKIDNKINNINVIKDIKTKDFNAINNDSFNVLSDRLEEYLQNLGTGKSTNLNYSDLMNNHNNNVNHRKNY